MAYINGREIIDFVRFGVDAYPLGGTWRFKYKQTPPPVQLIEQPLNFYYYDADGCVDCTKIYVVTDGSSTVVSYEINGVISPKYEPGWVSDGSDEITFAGTQEVSKDFYYWFTANAVQITEA